MNRTQRIAELLSYRTNSIGNFAEMEFLRLPSNETAFATLTDYLKNDSAKPLIILGAAGSGKTHLVSHVLHEQKIKAPQVSVEYFWNACQRRGLSIEEIDVAVFHAKFKAIYIDDSEALNKAFFGNNQKWAKFFLDLAKTGCKVILTPDEISGHPSAHSIVTSLASLSENDVLTLAKFSFYNEFDHEPRTEEDMRICTEALAFTDFRSVRSIQASIKRASLTRKIQARRSSVDS